MLSCLGCNVLTDGSCPNKVFNDNFSMVQNRWNPAADLSKKYVDISYHIVSQTVSADIIKPYWINGEYNMSDILTKQISNPQFMGHCYHIFW